MFLTKTPDHVSKNGSVLIYNNALSEKLLKKCSEYLTQCIENDIYSYTNKSWEPRIKADSNEIKVINLKEKNKKLHLAVCKEIEINYNLITKNMAFNIHIMKEGCYVGEHDDGHVEYAISIYLTTLEEKDGGIFQYVDTGDSFEKNTYKNIIPELNKMVVIKNTDHRVSEIVKPKYRAVLQGFYTENFFYKGQSINRLFHIEKPDSIRYNL